MKKTLTALAMCAALSYTIPPAAQSYVMRAASAPTELADEKPKLTKVVFAVSVTCDNCRKRIEKNLAFEKGVKEIKVDIPSKTVAVTFKTAKSSPEKLKAALEKLGYTAEIKIVAPVK